MMHNMAKNLAQAKITWHEQTVDVADLKPYERNPRRISKESYERLLSSLRDNGYHQRIIAQPDLRIIGGHQRIKALQELGFDKVQVLVPSEELTLEQFRRVLVQDNLPFGEFDFEILSADFDVAELTEWGMPADWLTGMDTGVQEGLTDADAIPDLDDKPTTVLGDIWLLGDHRIMCGDSTDATMVTDLLDGEAPMLMVTDPPYGVNYDATWRGKAGHATKGKNRTGIVEHDDRADWREVWALFPGSIVYVWHGGLMSGLVADSLTACGFTLRSQIIWNKTVMAMSRGDYHWKHEPCWYAVKETGNWTGDRKQTTVWDFASPLHIMSGSKEEKTEHPTQKPVECMKRPIENNSKPGDLVYEPFSGSGTTIIAAEQTGRKCLAMEISPAYVSMAVMRWQNFTGKEATHAETGDTFLQVSQARLANAGKQPVSKRPAGNAARAPRRAAGGKK
jgi:DNA modification methylase